MSPVGVLPPHPTGLQLVPLAHEVPPVQFPATGVWVQLPFPSQVVAVEVAAVGPVQETTLEHMVATG